MRASATTDNIQLAFAAGRSLDPRTVLVTFVTLALWITHAPGVAAGVAAAGVSVLLAAIPQFNGTGAHRLLRLFRWTLPFALLVFCLYVLMGVGDGGPGVHIGPLSFQLQALETGAHLALRLFAFVFLAHSLMLYATPAMMAAGLTRFALPTRRLGLRPATLYHFLFITLRLLPALAVESRTIRLAQRSRGWRPRTRWLGSVRSAPAVVVPVFAAAMRRADALATVMISRGFDPAIVPANVLMLRLSGVDYAILSVNAVAWALWIWVRFL